MKKSSFDPDLFLTAQDPVWPQVERELLAGQKTSHWIWYIFPQLKELGRSGQARLYGLSGLDDAAAYLDHPKLRDRLIRAGELLLIHSEKSAEDILGHVDALKARSSMTLFSRVPGAPVVFAQVLDRFYDGDVCPISARAH